MGLCAFNNLFDKSHLGKMKVESEIPFNFPEKNGKAYTFQTVKDICLRLFFCAILKLTFKAVPGTIGE